jgi:DNA-binding XRE family transcriptional regulator
MEHIELISQLNALSAELPPSLQRELAMVLHKLTYPMKDILAKVPGLSLTERAKKLKVSRQTLYVWGSEKFRPTLKQAKRISKVTGIPVEHILDDGFEGKHVARRKAHKKVAGVAKASRKTPKRNGGATPVRRRKAPARKRSEAA